MTRCHACQSEAIEEVDAEFMCLDCGEMQPASQDEAQNKIKVGKILSLEPVPGKDKLKKVMVDVGGTEPVRIVTNAGNVKQSDHVVVALVGAVIGGHEDGEEVKKATVGGVVSHGMLCDGPMLGWGPGNKGRAAVLPESFAVGSFAPTSKPRGD